jgi:hypothetical protein
VLIGQTRYGNRIEGFMAVLTGASPPFLDTSCLIEYFRALNVNRHATVIKRALAIQTSHQRLSTFSLCVHRYLAEVTKSRRKNSILTPAAIRFPQAGWEVLPLTLEIAEKGAELLLTDPLAKTELLLVAAVALVENRPVATMTPKQYRTLLSPGLVFDWS